MADNQDKEIIRNNKENRDTREEAKREEVLDIMKLFGGRANDDDEIIEPRPLKFPQE